MISASEIHELRFEKAAFGYKQEDIDEFLNKLEEEAAIAQRELDDSNNKIQVLADKVREYMRDEDALKDALLGAQKEGHRIISEANAKAEEIIAQAKEKADAMMDEVTVQHDALIEKNEAVDRGVDFFDCVYPSRNGRHGHVYTNHGKMNLFNAKYELDDRPIEEGCNCPACRSYSRAYIRHLLKAKEMLGMRLCVLHNLYFYNTMMEEIRDAIDAGEFQAYKKRKLEGMEQK